MKLISCTDFVLEQEKKGMQNTDRPLRFERILKYAKFLKQPLTLSMFVPTDDDGNVLKEAYEVFERDCTECDEYIFRHQQAKERVIFEGFKVINKSFCQFITNGKCRPFYKEDNDSLKQWKNESELIIEDLVKFNLTITTNAVKTYQL